MSGEQEKYITVGQPYPEELEELRVHEGAKEEQQEHDPVLHESNRMLRRIYRAARTYRLHEERAKRSRYIPDWTLMWARRNLDRSLKEYERVVGGEGRG